MIFIIKYLITALGSFLVLVLSFYKGKKEGVQQQKDKELSNHIKNVKTIKKRVSNRRMDDIITIKSRLQNFIRDSNTK